MNPPVLNKAIDDGKLNSFADNILLQADNVKVAEYLIEAIQQLKVQGLCLNMEKSLILSDHKEVEGMESISGLKIVKKLKYLGL